MLWYDAIYPYNRNTQIMYCPNHKDIGPGYGMNPLCTHLQVSRIWDASSCVVVADVLPEAIGARAGWPATGQPARWWVNDPGNDICRAAVDVSYSGLGVPAPHNDGVIYGFTDGHVKWARQERMDQPYNWNPSVPSP